MHLNEDDILQKGKAIEKLKHFCNQKTRVQQKSLLTVTLTDFPGDEFYQ